MTTLHLPRINLATEIGEENFDNITGEVVEFFQKIIDMGKIDESTLLSMEKEKFLQMAAKPESLKKSFRQNSPLLN